MPKKPTTIYLDETLHQRAVKEAAKRGLSLSAFITVLLGDALPREA